MWPRICWLVDLLAVDKRRIYTRGGWVSHKWWEHLSAFLVELDKNWWKSGKSPSVRYKDCMKICRSPKFPRNYCVLVWLKIWVLAFYKCFHGLDEHLLSSVNLGGICLSFLEYHTGRANRYFLVWISKTCQCIQQSIPLISYLCRFVRKMVHFIHLNNLITFLLGFRDLWNAPHTTDGPCVIRVGTTILCLFLRTCFAEWKLEFFSRPIR